MYGNAVGDAHGGVEGGVGGWFDEAIAAQEGGFEGGVAGGVGDSRVSIAGMAEKDIDFGARLRVLLHWFSGAFSGLVSMLEMVEKDNVCAGGLGLASTVEIAEKDTLVVSEQAC